MMRQRINSDDIPPPPHPTETVNSKSFYLFVWVYINISTCTTEGIVFFGWRGRERKKKIYASSIIKVRQFLRGI